MTMDQIYSFSEAIVRKEERTHKSHIAAQLLGSRGDPDEVISIIKGD